MTTDPRLAPLSEALDSEWPSIHAFDDGGVWMNYAKRLLAALPPDWCGHGAILDANNADIRDRDEALANIREAAIKTRADLARLRAIEEAARAVDWESVQDALDVAIHARAEMEVNKVRWRADENATDALRAALDGSER